MIRRIVKNTFFLSASQLIGRIIGFFYFIFLARFLGVETFGIYNFTLAFIYNFIPVADFGMERLVLRDISREQNKTSFYLSRLLPLRFLFSLGAYIGALLLALALGQNLNQIIYLAVYGLFIFPFSFTYLLTGFFNAKEKMHFMAGANIAGPVLTAILGTAFVLLKFPLVFVFLAAVIAHSFTALFFLFKSFSWGLKLGWVVDRKFWKKVLSQSWAFAFLLILAVFYLRLSLIMVGLIKGPYFTGLYGSAFKFTEAIILIPQALALALFPLSSRLFLQDKKKLFRIYKKGLGVLFLMSLPFVLVFSLFSKFIIGFAYGSDYLAAAPVLVVLGFALVLFFLNVLPGNIIQNSPQFKRFLPWAALNFIVKLILCLVLIPRFSIMGAAYAVLGGELVGLVINNVFVLKVIKK